jgi:hypothetical protein
MSLSQHQLLIFSFIVPLPPHHQGLLLLQDGPNFFNKNFTFARASYRSFKPKKKNSATVINLSNKGERSIGNN